MVLVETVLGTGDGQTRLGAGAGSGIVLTAGEIDGYAIAIDDALAIIEQIRAGEETDGVRVGAAAFLGVELAGSSGFDNGQGGAMITGVSAGGAAESATVTLQASAVA